MVLAGLAGMLSSKQYYALDLERWLAEHGADPLGGGGWPCNQSWPDLPGRSWQLTDIVGQNVFEQDGGELASPGLFVDLGPWQFHLLALQ